MTTAEKIKISYLSRLVYSPSDRIAQLRAIQKRWNKKKGLAMLRDIKKSRAAWS